MNKIAFALISSALTISLSNSEANSSVKPKATPFPQLKLQLTNSSLKLAVDTTPAATPPPTKLPSLYKDDFKAADIKSCLVSLCGPMNTLQSGTSVQYDRTTHPSLAGQYVWQSEFAKISAEILTKRKANNVLSAQAMLNALKTGVLLREDGSSHAFMGFYKLLKTLTPKLVSIFELDRATYKFKINEAEEKQAIDALQPSEAKAAKLFLEYYWDTFIAEVDYSAPKTNRLITRLKSRYPKMTLGEAQKTDAKLNLMKLEAARSRAGETIVNLLIGVPFYAALKEAASGTDLSSSQSDLYLQAVSSVAALSTAYGSDASYQAFMAVPLDLAKALQNFRENGKAEKALAEAKGTDVEKAQAEIAKLCQGKLTSSLDLNTSEFRTRRFQSVINDVKRGAMKVVPRFTTPSGAADAVQAVNQIEFSMMPSNAEKIRSLKDIVSLELSRTGNGSLISGKTPEEIQLLLMAAAMSENYADVIGNDLLKDSDLKKGCEDLPVNSISDAAMSSLGRISLSWYSVNYPEYGAAIVAHEIGHVMSSFLRSQQSKGIPNDAFSDSLTCVANRNPFLLAPSERLANSGNTKWSEEDWADYFSTQVMKELKASQSPAASKYIMACSLVDNYGELLYDVIAPSKDDTHSSGLLRTLLMANDAYQMTPQCQGFLAPIQAAGRSLRCD